MCNKLSSFAVIAAAILMAACNPNTTNLATTLRTGDLVFVADTSGMGSAVIASTGSFSHAAIIESTDSGLFVWEAVPRSGVIRRGLKIFLSDYSLTEAEFEKGCANGLLRIEETPEAFDTARLVELLHQHIGQPYDDYFLPDNGRTYCSELIEECFYNKDGERIFSTTPMNFRDAEGSMPEFWTRWFDSLGTPIPEGTPGTNPTQIYHQTSRKGIQN